MNVREIAKLANVSIATVSRVINRPEVVLPETREQVLAVMRKVGYSPAPHAGGGAQPKAVGLLVPDAEDYLAIRLMAGIESVAARREHAVYLCSTKGGPDRERQAIAGALEQRMRELVIYTNTLSAEDAADLQRRRVPFVLVGRSEAAPRHNACYINYEEGGYRMVRHLLELGHQKFLLLCEAGSPNIEARMWEGLCRARRELMTGPGGDRVLHAEGGSIRAGYDAAREVLAGERPDAVFASSDELALGLMKALQENGVGVPGQIAVTGFTDSPVAGVVTPELTTVEQPTHRLGMVAARMLFDLIDDESLLDGTPQEIVLLPKLKVRNSCGNRKPINTLFE